MGKPARWKFNRLFTSICLGLCAVPRHHRGQVCTLEIQQIIYTHLFGFVCSTIAHTTPLRASLRAGTLRVGREWTMPLNPSQFACINCGPHRMCDVFNEYGLAVALTCCVLHQDWAVHRGLLYGFCAGLDGPTMTVQELTQYCAGVDTITVQDWTQ